MSAQIWKWKITLGEGDRIQTIGRGPVVMLDRHNEDPAALAVWTIESVYAQESVPTWKRLVTVIGTGWDIPEEARHLRSVLIEGYAWHLFAVGEQRGEERLMYADQEMKRRAAR